MKVFLVAICMLMTSAYAGEIKIKALSKFELWGARTASQAFGINAELGRAWVSVTIHTHDPDGGSDDTERFNIAGLSYDKLTKTINIDVEGKITTCAQYKTLGRGIFRRQELVMAPECRFESKWKTSTFDNGFEIVTRKKLHLSLIID